jgi:tetratricopeptide (TPR) repeat protein
VVHVADFREVPGKKIWSWGVAGDGLIWTDLLTDHDGPYNEIQSGRYETQLRQEFMPPRRVESWTEYWYPVQGLQGGFLEATESLALNVAHPTDPASSGGVKLTFWPVVAIPDAKIIAKARGETIREFGPLELRPAVAAAFALPGNLDQRQLTVEVEDRDGRVPLHWSAADPIDGNPDFVPAAGAHAIKETPGSEASAEELFLRGVEEEKRGDEESAAETFKQVLDHDQAYTPALIKLAWHSYRVADLPAAEAFIGRAVARNSADPQVEYATGIIDRAAERWPAAKDAFWASIHHGGALAPALAQLGEISIRERDYDEAVRYLRDALAHEPEDAMSQTDLSVALRLGGHAAEAASGVDAALRAMLLLPYALAEAWRVKESGGNPQAFGRTSATVWNRPLPQDIQYYLEVAAWYLRLGDLLSANAVLSSARSQLPTAVQAPLLNYYLAYVARRLGESDQADSLETKSSGRSDIDAFPNRFDDEIVLADAHSHIPKDGRVCYLLGTFFFAHGRYDDGAKLWREAVDNGFDSSVLERNLGVYAWRVKKDLPTAAASYEKSIRLAPDQYRSYPDLDEIYSELGDQSGRARLFASAPPAVLDRDGVRVRRALWLVEQHRFDAALSELANHRFKPWEGGEIVREMYVLACIAKGRQALGARRRAEAEQDFRRALEYPPNLGVGKPDKPQDEQALYWLGQALAAQGNAEAAHTAWREAADENPQGEPANSVYRAAALGELG